MEKTRPGLQVEIDALSEKVIIFRTAIIPVVHHPVDGNTRALARQKSVCEIVTCKREERNINRVACGSDGGHNPACGPVAGAEIAFHIPLTDAEAVRGVVVLACAKP